MSGPRGLRRGGSARVANPDGRMSLADHLYELRGRLLKSAIAFAVVTVLAYIWYEPIFDFIKSPYCSLPEAKRSGGEQCQLVFFGVLDGFMLRLRVASIAGALLSSPYWLYQLWSFITPGLRRNERRWALTFVAASTTLFFVGAALAYLTLSKGLALLLGIAGDGVIPFIEVTRYLRYVIAMLLAFGISFEFPLLVVMLNLAGVVRHARLASWRRSEIFLVFLFAAVVTPSQDPFTMLALAVPMCVLYEVALVITRVHDRRKARREQEQGWGHLDDDDTSPLDDRPSDLSHVD